ncbi:MAG: indolepyruvate ferredoxin oxidoreductase subunit alpha, partial [Oscillospiraceae bacterium]|nr:indolepyruvate ferredoxin oxidoreductase subunit alpha [Oscillospiraceae bacterium]
AEALEFTKLAYQLSEEYDTPVIVKMCTRVAHSQSIMETSPRTEHTKEYKKDIAKYVMMPANAKKRHPIVEERTAKLVSYAETAEINRIEQGESNKMGFITSSTSYQYIKEVFGDRYPVLKLGMIWPLPTEKIKTFAASVDSVVVVEELDSFIESHCRNIGVDCIGKEKFSLIDELSQGKVAAAMGIATEKGIQLEENIPPRPPVMCAGCPHRGLFYTLKKNKLNVLGDIGCYTLGAVAPLSALDSTICMGASVSGLHGFCKSSKGQLDGNSVAVIGDSTFMHSGITGLVNIAYNQSNSTVIIVDNSITGMTGHQHNPTTGFNLKGEAAAKVDLEALCRAVGINRVRVVDPYNLKECDEVIKEELKAAEPSVIISRRPCALLKNVKHAGPIAVDSEKCKGCKACMQIGCPAISMENGVAKIDATQCTGCSVCKQMCHSDAFKEV